MTEFFFSLFPHLCFPIIPFSLSLNNIIIMMIIIMTMVINEKSELAK